MAQRALPVLVLAARGECRFSSHRCACCAGAASSDAAARELSLEAGLCTPIDLLEGRHKSVPSLPVLENSTSGESAKASASYSGVACSRGCGEVFCSANCEKKFAKSGHQLLCVGPLESLEHPLCVFRRLCASLGEEVLLAGQLLAAALTELKEEQGGSMGPATSTVRALVARGLAADENAARTTASNESINSSASKTIKAKMTNQSEKGQRDKNKSKRENEIPEAEEEDEGWEGEAFSALRAGLFDAHGIRPREIAVALGAVQGGYSAKSSPAKSADHISAGKRWRALLRQVEQCAVPVELESLASTYCRQAMFSSPAVLAEVESAVTPLLSRIEAKKLAQIQAESGAEARDNDDEEEEGDDDDGGGWETESSNGDDDRKDDSLEDDSAAAAAAVELKEEVPKKQAIKRKAASSSLWPVGWNPPLGEKADALLSPWTAIALFPLEHFRKDGDSSCSIESSSSSSDVAAAKQGEAVDHLPKVGGPLLMPHFQRDLPHSCLPTHILKVEPCNANAASSSSSMGSNSVGTFLGAFLEPIPIDQGGCAPSPKSTESSGGNYGYVSTYSRCYVNASRGRKARARELMRRSGAASGSSQEKGGMEIGGVGDDVSSMGCTCLRCTWERAALPTSPGGAAGSATVTADEAAVKDEKGAVNLHKGRSDAEAGEVALKAAVFAVTSKKTNSTATAVGEVQSRTTNDVNSLQIESISISDVDTEGTDAAWDLLRRLTNQAMQQERYEDALVALAGMRHLKPRDGDALYLTAVALRRMERWSPAKSIAQGNDSSPTGDSAAAPANTATSETRNEDSNSAVAISELDSRMGAHAFFLAANAAASPPHPLLQAAAAEIIALDVFADHESPSRPSLHVKGNQGDDVSSSPPELPLPPQAQAQEPLLSQCQPPIQPSSSGEVSLSSGSRLLLSTWPVAAVAAACLERKAVAQRTNLPQDDDDDNTTVDSSEDRATEGSGDWEDVDDEDDEDEGDGAEEVRDTDAEANVDETSEKEEDLVRSVFVTRAASSAGRSTMAPPVLSLRECAWAVATAEDFAVSRGGWTTQRHYAVPTTDLPLHEVPQLLPWFRDLCKHRIFPLLGALYPNIVGKTDGSQLRINDAFVVKYCAAGQQRHLPLHVDQSTISLTVALNGHDHAKDAAASGVKEEEEVVLPTFAGGGTYFESLGEALVPEPGGLVAFPGDCSHGGMPITGGTRYIIAAFLYVLE